MSVRHQSRTPLISIVIDNCNYGRFVGEAIDSALAQNYANIEVIVVDDGSHDDSRGVIADYGRSIIAIFKDNGGQASALNAGFRASAGEIVIFLDADDRLYADAAATVASRWHPELARIQYPLDYIGVDGEKLGRTTPVYKLDAAAARRALLRGPLLMSSPTSGNAFTRSVLARIMPIPEHAYRLCADGYLAACSPFLGGILSLERPLGQMRIHGANNFSFAAAELGYERDVMAGARAIYRTLKGPMRQPLPPFRRWIAGSPSFWLARLRRGRANGGAARWRLTLAALRANLGYAPYRRRKRLMLAMWILALAYAPANTVAVLCAAAAAIANRTNASSRWRRVLGSVDRVESFL